MTILNQKIPFEIIVILLVIFGVLSACSIVFYFLYKKKKTNLLKELIVRVNSWWKLAFGVAVVITFPPIYGTIIIAYVSFVALREMFSISRIRSSDRNALFLGYFSIPVQYYFAYMGFYEPFLYFIPMVMFISLTIVLVLSGDTTRIGISMSIIPTMLMLTVYMLSHIVLLFNFDSPSLNIHGGSLIIFLIMLTAFNDVFQFTWGKLLGKRKILPKVSPNKTWAGFIGGILTTAVLAVLIRFLTPLSIFESFLIGLLIGIFGFLGDVLISSIKRDLRIKDTDDLIPGHGGAMDRLDSIILTAPIFFHVLKFFIEK